MKIQYASDLHLEFPENRKFLTENPIKPVGDILILAGDIGLFARMELAEDFFRYVSEHFPLTYWLPGNHEYYHSDILNFPNSFKEEVEKNIFRVNNMAVVHENVKLIFSTFWTHIRKESAYAVEQRMADFHVIRKGAEKLAPEDVNYRHDVSKQFLQEALAQKSKHTLVATHHVPTFENYPVAFKGDALNEAFASEQSEFIKKSTIDYWIYGHHHQPVKEFTIGRTRLVNNQLGYVRYEEHKGFDSERVIEL